MRRRARPHRDVGGRATREARMNDRQDVRTRRERDGVVTVGVARNPRDESAVTGPCLNVGRYRPRRAGVIDALHRAGGSGGHDPVRAGAHRYRRGSGCIPVRRTRGHAAPAAAERQRCDGHADKDQGESTPSRSALSFARHARSSELAGHEVRTRARGRSASGGCRRGTAKCRHGERTKTGCERGDSNSHVLADTRT